jgi:hypothetical protein
LYVFHILPCIVAKMVIFVLKGLKPFLCCNAHQAAKTARASLAEGVTRVWYLCGCTANGNAQSQEKYPT